MSQIKEKSVALYFYRLSDSGGAERMVCQLASELAIRGFKVCLISLDEPDAESYYSLHESVRWEKLGLRSGMLDKIRRTHLMARLLKNNGVRVLVGFVMSGDRSVYAAAKISGVRLVAAERNAPAMYHLRYSRLQRWIMYGCLRFADNITVQMPEFVSDYPAGLQKRIKIIPNPVATVSHKAKPGMANDNKRFTLLAVSRLDEVQKGIDCLIRAYSRIKDKHPEWELHIVGEGPQYNSLVKLIRELGLESSVTIHAPTSDIFNYYRHANLFVIPSLWEGFPNALAEAMSHGLPAVGFRNAAGVSGLIRDCGWLAEGLDDDIALSDALDSAMSDGEERVFRGKAAARVIEEFTPSRQFDRWEALLDSIISE